MTTTTTETKTDEPIKIDKWDANACKNTLDDAAKNYFRDEYKMVESFKLMDTKLVLCTTAVLVSGFACLWDWLYPFPQSREILIICGIVYIVLTAVFTAFVTLVEKQTISVAYENDETGVDAPNKWSMSSGIRNRFSPEYELQLTCHNGVTKGTASKEVKHAIEAFFDVNGKLCLKAYHKVLRELKQQVAAATEKKRN